MSELLKKQWSFSLAVGALILEVEKRDLRCSLGECLRSQEQAELNAISGAARAQLIHRLEITPGMLNLAAAIGAKRGSSGISKSLHRISLAIDLNLFTPDGTYLDSTEHHRPFGEWWETTFKEQGAAWGGRFGDGNHYSFEHEGVK